VSPPDGRQNVHANHSFEIAPPEQTLLSRSLDHHGAAYGVLPPHLDRGLHRGGKIVKPLAPSAGEQEC
jgi:hypothetical protein